MQVEHEVADEIIYGLESGILFGFVFLFQFALILDIIYSFEPYSSIPITKLLQTRNG